MEAVLQYGVTLHQNCVFAVERRLVDVSPVEPLVATTGSKSGEILTLPATVVIFLSQGA